MLINHTVCDFMSQINVKKLVC